MAAAREASGEPVSAAAVRARLAELSGRAAELAGAVDLDGKRRRLAEIEGQLATDWDDREQSTRLLREQSRLKEAIEPVARLAGEIRELAELAELAGAEEDAKMIAEVGGVKAPPGSRRAWPRRSLRALLDQPHDACDCFVDVQFGAGGDESQDWARMLCRMYTGYAAGRGWKVIGHRGDPRRSRHQELHPAAGRRPTPTATCAPKPASTGWCASRRLIPTIAATPPSRRSLPIR